MIRNRSVEYGRMKWYPCDMKKSRRIWIAAAALAVLGSAIVFGLFANSGRLPFFTKEDPQWILEEYDPEELLLFSLDDADLAKKGIVVNDALFLINVDRPIPEGYEFSIGNYKSTDVPMNLVMHEDYSELSAAVTEVTGDKLYVMSSFRTADEQRVLYEENSDIAAEPGKSEHQSGLALDVYVFEHAGAGFLNSEAGKYVNRHCFDYGFIIRYPKDKEKITGFLYEPWHIRYVGQPHARLMALSELTLEEYIEKLDPGEFYRFEYWIVSRQTGPEFRVPRDAIEITVSADNTGFYVITARME